MLYQLSYSRLFEVLRPKAIPGGKGHPVLWG